MTLDVAEIGHGHARSGRTILLVHRIRFQSEVDSSDLYQGFGGVQLLIDVDRDRGYERAIRFVLNNDGSMAAEAYAPGPRVVGYANWWRPDARTVKIAFPKSLLKRDLRVYRWKVLTAQTAPCEASEETSADGCVDSTRTLTHRL